ncbi:hypothetical protein G7Y89_g13837 [Cudoniella acicularis]|uniref:C3H1-type domain-containing protein n=1 Tax=Cudoniella acicularis TaxID=354080 RepID=A0A8H4R8I5_9HELO|nr:hypothetical protein G7Y89_g13837 [Cudoniella acicularis]
MSTLEATGVSPQISVSVSDGPPKCAKEPVPVTSEAPDIEMTSPLTSNDDNSTGINTPPPTPRKGMLSFNNGRERMGSRSASGENQPNSNSPNSAGPQYSSSYPPPQYAHASNYGGGQVVPYYNRGRANSQVMGENTVPLSSVVPGPVWPSDIQLNTAYAYAIQREDGSFTRLIRADQLDSLDGIPRSQGPEGVIVLPQPRQMSPRRRQSEVMIPMEVVNELAGSGPNGNRSRRSQTVNRYDAPYDATQMQIDNIIANSSMSSPPPPQAGRPPYARKEKIYCDKWIHEGVCAFTQMGCKYRHEMPMDKATQLSLGLNFGLPNWYRRAYGVNLNSPPPALPPSLSSPPNPNRVAGPWRRIEAPPGMGGNGNEEHSQGPPGSAQSYGPIGPPPTIGPYSHFGNGNNSHCRNVKDENEEEADSDTVTWTGRRR